MNAFEHLVIRGICFLVAAFYLLASWWVIFVRSKLGDDWFQSHTGKAAFPGSVRACVIFGLVALGIAAVFVFFALRF